MTTISTEEDPLVRLVHARPIEIQLYSLLPILKTIALRILELEKKLDGAAQA